MKLREFLETIDKDDIVAIGAASSFLYFGSPDCTEELEKISKELLADSKKILNDARYSLNNLPSLVQAVEDEYNKRFDEYRDIALGPQRKAEKKKAEIENLRKDIFEICRKMVYYEDKKHSYRYKIMNLSSYRSKFVPLLDREVKGTYRQKASDYALVIFVEGSETGKYWTLDEYQNGGGEREEPLE